MIQFIQISR